MPLTHELLYNRHRLSHQQIDDFTGEKQGGYLSEKLGLMQKVNEFFIIADSLTKAGIKFVSFKGPLLSYRIYKDAAYRMSHDTDLLIEFQEIGKAIALFKEMGYQPIEYEWPEDDKSIQFIRYLRHEYNLYHPGKDHTVELHWNLFGSSSIPQEVIDRLVSENLSATEFTKRWFITLNQELNLIYLIIHGGLHAWFRLKWLVDVHEIVKRGLFDEKAFCNLVKQLKAERLVSLCNEMLARFYPGEPLLPDFEPCPLILVNHSLYMISRESESRYDTLKELIRHFIFVFSVFPGVSYKLKVLRYLFNSLKDEGHQYKSFSSLILSFLQPISFLKKRYKLELTTETQRK
jgi:hypothetical protein